MSRPATYQPTSYTDMLIAKLRADNKALLDVLEAARCIKHWHDNEQIGGMVVSAEHVRKLWSAIAEHDSREAGNAK